MNDPRFQYVETFGSLAVGQVRESLLSKGTIQAIEASGFVLLRSKQAGSHVTRRVWCDIIESWRLVETARPALTV